MGWGLVGEEILAGGLLKIQRIPCSDTSQGSCPSLIKEKLTCDQTTHALLGLLQQRGARINNRFPCSPSTKMGWKLVPYMGLRVGLCPGVRLEV